jgi:hypothetical protein
MQIARYIRPSFGVLVGTVLACLALSVLALPAAKSSAASLPGWHRTCHAPNWITGDIENVPDSNVYDPGGNYWGFTNKLPGGHWATRYNTARIFGPASTPVVLKFLFYHECAHANADSPDEHVADCDGLDAMDDDIGVSGADMDEITQAYASVGRSFPSGGEC